MLHIFAAICTTDADCAHTEECQYIKSSLNYECVCKPGLERDSQNQCVSLQGNCGGGTCVENAECLYDNEIETYYCKCKPDYIGDGITECKLYTPTCKDLNNCGQHADCIHDALQSTFYCKCQDGFYGDGYACYKERDCQVDPSMCHQFATCVTDGNRRFRCRCLQGYHGNGTDCNRIAKQEGNFILLNQGMSTLKIPYLENENKIGKVVQVKSSQTAVGLDIDCLGERMYWGDITGKAIRSAAYNGTNKTDFITKGTKRVQFG